MDQPLDQPKETAVSDVEVFDFPKKEATVDHYELLLLVLGSYSDEEAALVFEQTKQYITEAGGTITSEQVIGRRTLAYKIQLQRVGSYAAVEFDIKGQALQHVREKLRIRKDVARFLIVKKRTYTAEEKMELQRRNEKITAIRNAKMNALEGGKDADKKKRRPRPSFRKPAAPEAQPAASTTATASAVAAAQPSVTPAGTEQPAAPQEPQAPVTPKTPKTTEEIDQEIDKLLSDDLSV